MVGKHHRIHEEAAFQVGLRKQKGFSMTEKEVMGEREESGVWHSAQKVKWSKSAEMGTLGS